MLLNQPFRFALAFEAEATSFFLTSSSGLPSQHVPGDEGSNVPNPLLEKLELMRSRGTISSSAINSSSWDICSFSNASNMALSVDHAFRRPTIGPCKDVHTRLRGTFQFVISVRIVSIYKKGNLIS